MITDSLSFFTPHQIHGICEVRRFYLKNDTKVAKFFNICNTAPHVFCFFHFFFHSALFSHTFRRTVATSVLQNTGVGMGNPTRHAEHLA